MSMAPLSLESMREAIEAANRRYVQAFNAGDVEGSARGVYTRDARILPPGGEPVQGRENIVQFWKATVTQLGIQRVELATVEVQPMGDGACEIGRATITLAGGVEVPAKYVVIWKREDGLWRWDVDIWNLSVA